MNDPIPADYRRPRSPALAALHDRFGIGTDPGRTAEYMQAVDDAREVQEIAEERDGAIADRDAALASLAAVAAERDAWRRQCERRRVWMRRNSSDPTPDSDPDPASEPSSSRDRPSIVDTFAELAEITCGNDWDGYLAELEAERNMPGDLADARAERDAAQGELAEGRRLLAMATAFDAGPLLGGVPAGWQFDFLDRINAKHPATIERQVDPGPVGGSWLLVLSTTGPDLLGRPRLELRTMLAGGSWRAAQYFDRGEFAWFESPAAAHAALDTWRAARRAEIAGVGDAGRGEAVAQQAEETD